jgi:predicted aldo/keto reductase-like oxidoreductase
MKYLDLAELGDENRHRPAHYLALGHRADECVACGACEANCPFEVPVISRLERARQVFGA